MDFNIELAILIGAILTVTGPTVVVPLLRHVRPRGRVSTVAKWEGITIDPVGAIIAVLVLETLLLIHEPAQGSGHTGLSAAAEHVVIGLGLEIFVAIGVSVAATFFLLVILKQRLVPDFLRNPVTLMIVVAAFVVSNVLKEESGLLTTTIMGIALANQPYAPVQRIIEFKENLQVLLIGSLFILLSARLNLSALEFITVESIIFLGLLVILVRPLAVFLSTYNTQLEWEEQAFLSWLAPRGIVAAAVASLFAYQLRNIYPDEVAAIVPTIFFIIVGTVAIYGLTAAPLARWLGIAEPNPEGLLFVGASDWVRHVAGFLHEHGHDVYLIDANGEHVRRAQDAGLPASRANALSETALDDLDLSSIGRLLITIPNDEVASLTALHFSEVFETTDIYQLASQHESRHSKQGEMPKHLRGRPLFGENTSYADIEDHFDQGGTVRAFDLDKNGGLFEDGDKEYYTYEDLQQQTGDITVIPLFIVRDDDLVVVSEESNFSLRQGDTLISMVGASERVHLVEEDDSSIFFFDEPKEASVSTAEAAASAGSSGSSRSSSAGDESASSASS
jgi:NhaP-type Na+/H+ or K+/H+ antiporter